MLQPCLSASSFVLEDLMWNHTSPSPSAASSASILATEHTPARPLKLAQTKSLHHAQTAMVRILLPVKNAQHSLPKKELEIQCTISAAREQAGNDASTEEAANTYARVVANSQADLINRNLALSEENARLREVIGTLRQDKASLQQRLDGYEQRLQTLEQSMVGGAHPDTPLVGVQKKHICGKCLQHHRCGRCPQTSCLKGQHGLTDRLRRHSWSTCYHASSPNRQDWGS